MVKCGVCAKFMAANVAVKCTQCLLSFHRGCTGLTEKSVLNNRWICSGCRNSTLTPPEGHTGFHTPQSNPSPCQTSTSNCSSNIDTASNPDLIKEIRAMRSELSSLRAEFRQYRKENAELKSAVNEGLSAMDMRISALEVKFEQAVPKKVDNVEDVIADLKRQLNDRDQEMLHADIEVSGIQELREESPIHLIKLLATKLGVNVEPRDIVHVERIGSTRRNRVQVDTTGGPVPSDRSADGAALRPRPIGVRFSRRETRDCILRAARVRRNITTVEVEVPGPPRRIYVNERLTPANRRLFYEARQAAQQHHWRYLWTRDGKILARQEDGKPVVRIYSNKDLIKVFGYIYVCSSCSLCLA